MSQSPSVAPVMKPNQLRRWGTVALALVAVALLIAARLLADARSWSLLANTLWLVGGTLLISVPLGVLLGLALFRYDVPLRGLLIALLLSPLVMPLYLQAAGWQAGFGMAGWFTAQTAGPYEPGLLEGWTGAIWVHALAATPWITLIVGLAARTVEPELEETALLDATPGQVLLGVTLPHALPAIGVAALWIAISVATEMTVTDLFQVGPVRLRTYAEEVYTQLALLAEPGQTPPAALVGIALTGALAACGIGLALSLARWTSQPTPRRPLVFSLGAARWPLAAAMGLVIAIMVAAPLVNLLVKVGMVVTPDGNAFARSWSLERAWRIVADSPMRYSREIGWSALIAAAAAGMVVLLATPLCWWARRSIIGGGAALVVTVAALCVPGPLVGGYLIEVFNSRDFFAAGQPVAAPNAQEGTQSVAADNCPLVNRVLNDLYDHTIFVVALAQAIRALPLGMLIVWHSLSTTPRELLDMAAVEGAGPWRQFFRVALPIRWPGLAVAAAVSFVVAIGELSATILVVPPGVMTLGVRISQLLHFNVQNELAGLTLVLMLGALTLTLGAAAIMWRRR